MIKWTMTRNGSLGVDLPGLRFRSYSRRTCTSFGWFTLTLTVFKSEVCLHSTENGMSIDLMFDVARLGKFQ